jgi:two-component system response regulator YesN
VVNYHNYDFELNEILRKQRARDSLGQLLESGSRDDYYRQLSRTVDPIRKIDAKNNLLANEAFLMASMSILSYINRWKLNEKIPACFSLKKLTNIDRHETWSAAVDFLYDLSEYLFTLQNDEQKKRADIAVDYIQKYAGDHLGEDLSLVRLAEQVYLNPSYLSRLFKQVKGMNLSDFIDGMRIKAAMGMLEKDAVKIHEVAKMTGYDSAASFTRFFRKMAGCSPLEYHESYLTNKCNQRR